MPRAGSPLHGISEPRSWSGDPVRLVKLPPQDIFDSPEGITLETFAYRSERSGQSMESGCVVRCGQGMRSGHERVSRSGRTGRRNRLVRLQ
jgi:hypothetical protein